MDELICKNYERGNKREQEKKVKERDLGMELVREKRRKIVKCRRTP